MEQLNPKPPGESGQPNEQDFLEGKTPDETPTVQVHQAQKAGRGKGKN